MDYKVIEFRGMPLLQKATINAPFTMMGEIKDMACFFYVLDGTMISHDARGVHHISEKEAIVKNCGHYVQRFASKQGSHACEVMAIYMYPEMLKEIYKDEIPSFLKEQRLLPPKKLIGNRLVEQYMSNLLLYFEEPDAFDDDLAILKLKELVMILLKSEGHDDIRKMLSEIFAPVNVKFKDAIEKNLYNNLSLEELAFICNMSLSSFKREFKKIFDDMPARYIKHRRLEFAASRLLCSEDSVSAIAYQSGFQDLTTFSAIFHEKYQTSPSKYRLSHSGK